MITLTLLANNFERLSELFLLFFAVVIEHTLVFTRVVTFLFLVGILSLVECINFALQNVNSVQDRL